MEYIIGQKVNPSAIDALIEDVDDAFGDEEGTLYIGYPVLATTDEALRVAASLVSPQIGLVIFDLGQTNAGATDLSSEAIATRQKQIVLALKARLLLHPELTRESADGEFELAIPINVFTYVAGARPAHLKKQQNLVTRSEFARLAGC